MRAEIFIGSVSVDILESTRPQITRRVIDISEPEKRKTDRTLSFTMPGSPTNDELFGSIFEVNLNIQNITTTNFNPDFNPNLKASFVYYMDTIEQLRGYCQLNQISITHDNKIIYELVAYGQTSDLFATIGDKQLTELDFSEYDHEYTRDNIINSWDTSIIENGSPVDFALGHGYVYPMIDYGLSTNPAQWRVDYFRPALYVKEYLDKIFDAAGFSYTSSFFDSTLFKSLIAPFVSQEFKISNLNAQNRLIDVERITSQQAIDPVMYSRNAPGYLISSGTPLIFNQENADPSNQWNSNVFTVANTGNYIFQGKITLSFLNNSAGTLSGLNVLRTQLAMVRNDGSQEIVVGTAQSPAISPGGTWLAGNETSTVDWFFQFPEVRLFETDEVYFIPLFVANTQANGNPGTVFFQGTGVEIINSPGSFLTLQLGNAQIVDGDDLVMNATIPKDIQQRDFLLGLIRMFNLYIEPDQNNPNILLIEPRDDYYTAEVEDWTYKLDESQPFNLEPMGLLDGEQYLFQYSPDTDYLNQAHINNYGFTYGRRRIVVNNQFVKQTKTIQPIFANTPLKAEPGFSSRVIPAIRFIDQNGLTSVKTAKMRILYYGGVLPSGGWTFIQLSQAGPVSILMTEYPYAGHLDNPFTPTFDLCFGAPQEIYYGAAFPSQSPLQYTDNNLYKYAWQKFTEEITDKDSKVASGFFHLSPADNQRLSFRRQYFIKEAYYRLLSVDNYDPQTTEPCLCTFIKIKEAIVADPVQEELYGGTGTIGVDILPPYNIDEPGDDNVYRPGQSSVSGQGNAVGGGTLKVSVVGDSNNVGGGVQNAVVMGGTDNQVIADDTVIINSESQGATESGQTIINDIRYPLKTTVPVLSAAVLTLGTVDVEAVQYPGEGRYLEAIAVYARRKNGTTPYSSEVITLQYQGGIIAATFPTELMTATADQIYKATILPDITEAARFIITTQSGSDPTGGDADIDFIIEYKFQDI